MILSRWVMIVSLVLAGYLAGAADSQVSIPLREKDRLILKLDRVQIKWIVSPGTQLQVLGLSESQGVRRGDSLIFDLRERLSREEFTQLSQNLAPIQKIEIRGPSLPTEIYARDINLQIPQFQHELKVQALSGQILISQSSGMMNLQMHKGKVQVQDSSGRTTIELYNGTAQLERMNEVNVEVLSGSVSSLDQKGNLSLKQYSGTAQIKNMNGVLSLHSVKSQTQLNVFQGQLEAQMEEGSLSGQVSAETEVRVKAQKSRVLFEVPKGSGAALNLWSGEGEIVLPAGLKVQRGAVEKSFRGRLPGEIPKISIHVRNSDGVTQIK